jgi:glycosyltransferase involved in cell wall biosynthesis
MLPALNRLSVIIPTFNRKALTERAVRSVLEQEDPIGTEVIVADDGSRDGTVDSLSEVFQDAVRAKRLLIESFERSGDPGTTRNRGVARSQGTYLAFLDSDDYWKPGRLKWLLPLLSQHDLILATDAKLGESADWVRTFLATNWAITSSAVIRRTLFEEVGGFPEGYFGAPMPKRLPGFEDYELWLRCLMQLARTDRRARFCLTPNLHVVSEPQAGGSGRMRLKMQMLREAVTLLHVSRKLPPRYWSTVAHRLAGAGKALLKK